MPDLGISRKHTSRCMLGACCAVALLAALAAPVLAAEPVPIGTTAVPGELIVQFEPGVPGSERAAARRQANVQAKEALTSPSLQLVKAEGGEASLRETIDVLESDSRVRFAERNRIRHTRDVAPPSDPFFGELWGLHNTGQPVDGLSGTPDADIDALAGWEATTGSPGVVVAVVDEGVAYDHPDLAGNTWANTDEAPDNVDNDGNGEVDDFQGYDFVEDDNDPRSLDGHGTHVAGTIAALGNNGVGTTGVSWASKIMPVRALDFFGGTDADLVEAFAYAAENGAHVVNGSFGGPGFSQAMSDAIDAAPDVLFVVAAGNGDEHGIGLDNDDPAQQPTGDFPCNFPQDNVICVAATNQNDNLATFSNFGPQSVDLGAPGVNVRSTFIGRVNDRFADNFENAGAFNARWDPGPSSNWGRECFGPELGCFATDSPAADYPAASATDWTLATAGPIDLIGRRRCSVRFEAALDTLDDPGDFLFVETSPDGVTWTRRGRLIGHTDLFIEGFETDLRSDGHQVFLRYGFHSDGDNVGGAGAFIDNVQVGCATTDTYAFSDGTSMATPHVAGAAALVLSANPGLDIAGLRDALLTTGDPLSALSGKTTSGRRLNVAGALGASEPPPSPPPASAPPVPPAQPPPVQPRIEAPAPDITAPRVSFTLTRGQRLRTLLRRGLRGLVGCNEPCALRLELVIDARTARRLRLTRGRRAVVVGRRSMTFDRAGRRRAVIRLTRRARARLGRARSLRFTVRLRAQDPSGNRRTLNRRVTLRR